MQNAIDANEKVEQEKRYILVKSEMDKQWLTILFENPYLGEILFENNRPVPNEEESDKEGLGLLFVEEVLSEVDGFLRYELDKEKMIFKVMVLVPIHPNQKQDV